MRQHGFPGEIGTIGEHGDSGSEKSRFSSISNNTFYLMLPTKVQRRETIMVAIREWYGKRINPIGSRSGIPFHSHDHYVQDVPTGSYVNRKVYGFWKNLESMAKFRMCINTSRPDSRDSNEIFFSPRFTATLPTIAKNRFLMRRKGSTLQSMTSFANQDTPLLHPPQKER